jgi:hypothetical protein
MVGLFRELAGRTEEDVMGKAYFHETNPGFPGHVG